MSSRYRRKVFTKEDNEKIYDKLSLALDLLSNENTRFHYFGSRRILLDKDEPAFSNIRLRMKEGYPEIYKRVNVDGIIKERSFGRWLLSLDDKQITADHENRNPLDNRRCNIRPISIGDNLLNRRRYHDSNTYKGVVCKKNVFIIEINSDYRTYRFSIDKTYTEKQAAEIYDCIALKLNGNIHMTNFNKELYLPNQIDAVWDKFSDKIRIRDRSNRNKKQIFNPLTQNT